MDARTEERTHGWTHGQMDGRVDGQTGGRTDKRHANKEQKTWSFFMAPATDDLVSFWSYHQDYG